jgi:hypothetical protein
MSADPWIPPASPSPNLKTALAYCDALNEWDRNKIFNVFDDTLQHEILPKSLARPILDKKGYVEYFSAMMLLFKRFRVSTASSACRLLSGQRPYP